MSNSIETRSTSALFKRAEQLRRWQESDTNREPNEPKRSRLMPFMTSNSNAAPTSHAHTNTTGKGGSSMRLKESGSGKMRVRFMDGCVFLAACAAADKDEVEKLTERGADIDTANVDGLTALHQACIDDNLEMVEFLVQRGSDVNRGDNEGWTPLHATASCGFISIARYLIDHGANVSAVNNDGELAIDIAESDEMEILLQKEIDARGIDCDDARNTEERLMLEDARQWLNAKQFKDTPHPKTGATALHVAAAKGYIKVMSLLIQSGAATNAQDLDGWTPLHAAAHWAQREACELLCENYANMDIKNYVGQTCFDVADPDVIRLLEELKKKQNTLQKDRPEIRNLINRPAIPAGTSPANTGKRSSLNNNTISAYNYNSNLNDNDRSSITRLSIDDKALRSKEVSTQERDLLLNKSPLVSETIPEANRASDSDKESDPAKRNRALQDIAPKTSSGVPKITLNKEEQSKKSASINDISKKTVDEANDNSDNYPWRRPASLRARTTNTGSSSVTSSKLSPSKEEEDVQLRRVHSFESDEKKRREDQLTRPKSDTNLQPHQVRRSFVPPVRDEESETQRKAHAKRVRETRRSTQGVTLEDLKSAEQLVKKSKQQEQQQRTSELQQLAATTTSSTSGPLGSTATTTVSIPSTTANKTNSSSSTSSSNSNYTTTGDADRAQERRPSWRLKMEGGTDRNRFRLEDSRSSGDNDVLAALRKPSAGKGPPNSSVPSISLTDERGVNSPATGSGYSPKPAIQRRKKPKRRSTGVVKLGDLDDKDEDESDSEDEDDTSLSTDGARQSGSSTLGAAAKSNSSHNQNGADVDYKKLWEESQKENGRLREDLDKVKGDLTHTRRQLDGAKTSTSGSSGTGLSDAEKREKKALERKLSEMEEELKQLQKLKVENERLKSENRALTRVVSKLTAAASPMPPSKSGSGGSSGPGSGSSASGPN